ncbi:hypothetical protein GCM10027047_31880 [Rhodococcus aerolatus]
MSPVISSVTVRVGTRSGGGVLVVDGAVVVVVVGVVGGVLDVVGVPGWDEPGTDDPGCEEPGAEVPLGAAVPDPPGEPPASGLHAGSSSVRASTPTTPPRRARAPAVGPAIVPPPRRRVSLRDGKDTVSDTPGQGKVDRGGARRGAGGWAAATLGCGACPIPCPSPRPTRPRATSSGGGWATTASRPSSAAVA